jgi:hypothetical protein
MVDRRKALALLSDRLSGPFSVLFVHEGTHAPMFPAPIDPLVVLVDLIAQVNPHLPTDVDLMGATYGAPQVYPYQPDSLIAANTTIAVTPPSGVGLSGTATVYYRRYELQELFPNTVVLNLQAGTVTTWQAFLSAINAACNTQFTQGDVPLTPFPVGATTVTYTPPSTSLLYMNSATFSLQASGIGLGTAVPNTVLNGLIMPLPTTLAGMIPQTTLAGFNLGELQGLQSN